MACRVCLGIVESMYGPGVPLYLSYFYPREKLGLRTGIFLSGAALANAYGGALAYGISQARGSIAPWKILFIVEGVPTCLITLCAWFFIPDTPQKARFLNEREREIAVALSLRQPGDRETQGLQLKQVLGSLLDYTSKCALAALITPALQTASLRHAYLSNRLPPRPDVLRLQRLLRLTSLIRPNHHLRDGRLLPNPVQRPQRTALRPLLDRDRGVSIHLRPDQHARAVRRRRRPRRCHRLHNPGDPDVRRGPVLRALPGRADLRLRGPHPHLGREHARDRLQAGGCVGHPGHGWSVWTHPGYQYLPRDGQALLPQGHVGFVRGVPDRRCLGLQSDVVAVAGESVER